MTDDDLAERQTQAHIRILHVLREFNLIRAPDIAPVIAALTASMLMRVPPEHRAQVAQHLDRNIAWFLERPPAGIVADHDA
jgi:hypothetical protein